VSAPAAVVELRGVEKEYPGSPPLRVLHGLDVAVSAGELVSVVGASGSGTDPGQLTVRSSTSCERSEIGSPWKRSALLLHDPPGGVRVEAQTDSGPDVAETYLPGAHGHVSGP